MTNTSIKLAPPACNQAGHLGRAWIASNFAVSTNTPAEAQ